MVDNIPVKMVKSCSSSISGILASLSNTTFHLSKFPATLKGAQVVPLHKKNHPLDKENYRTLSVLPIISKAFERVMHNQLSEHFNDLFNPFFPKRVWIPVYPATLLPCCACSRTGERPWTTISLLRLFSSTCLRPSTASPMIC